MLSAIEARLELDGASVLDLYAGSGALGLEAVSRGAGSVTLVERDPAAARVLRGNARAVRERLAREARIEVAAIAAERFLREREGSFQLVFLDPPYELGTEALGVTLGLLTARLAPDALVVVERSARDAEPGWPEGLRLERSRSYGETAVYYAHPA